MKGSEKQIAWALTVKEKLNKVYSDLMSGPTDNQEDRDETKKYYDLIIGIDDSKFWIEMRNMVGYNLNTEWMYEQAIKMGIN